MLKRSLFLAALIVLLSSAVWSQSPVKKSPAKARLFSLIVPSSGHIYAGKWLTGVYFLTGEAALIGGGFAAHSSISGQNKKWVSGSLWMGALLVHVLGFEHAGRTAEEYNKGLSLTGGYYDKTGSIGFAYKF